MGLDREKLVLMTEGSFGDSLLYIPTIRFLRQTFPNQELLVLGRDPNPRINIQTILGDRFAGVRIKNYVTGKSSAANYTSLFLMAYALRKERPCRIFDGCRIGPERSVKRLLQRRRFVGVVSGAAIDLGPAPLKEEMRLITETSPAPQVGDLILRRIMRAVGVEENGQTFSHLFPISAEDRGAANQWASANGLVGLARCYAVGLKSKVASREWPVERFLAVMKHLRDVHKLLPIFSGGPADAPLFREIIAALGTGHSVSNLSPGGEAALLTGARFFLGVNSGPMHLAAAAGLRCVVISSEDMPPGLWYPYGKGNEILYGVTNTTVSDVTAACDRLLSTRSPTSFVVNDA